MDYKIEHIPIDGVKRQGVKIVPTTITIHSTANPTSTAKNERDNLARISNTRKASFHLVVDDKEVVECIPLNEKTLHAGNSTGNLTSISVEICESGNREKTIDNAVMLVAKMLHERNWGVDKLKRHFDWSGKDCPRILNYNNWNGWSKFKGDVQKELEKLAKQVGNKEQTVSDWAKEAMEWAVSKRITDGTRPKDAATREEVWVMLYKMRNVR